MDGIWDSEKRLWTRSQRDIWEENCFLSGSSQSKREGGFSFFFLFSFFRLLLFSDMGFFFDLGYEIPVERTSERIGCC